MPDIFFTKKINLPLLFVITNATLFATFLTI